MRVAIIIGRFQAHYLHDGHQAVFDTAREECDRTIVFIGTSIVRSERNPLSYDMRREQVQTIYGSFEIHELKDEKTDEQWLESLFSKVDELTDEGDEVVYYGSRDSFLSTLPDGPNIVTVNEVPGLSGTNLRGSIQNRNSRWFREGYIKAILDEFPAHYAVVDAIVTDGQNVLLGIKKSGHCLIGGFADAEDSNLEAAVIREVQEETGLTIGSPTYFASTQCNDWRYRSARQPFTSVFSSFVDADYMQTAKASDDLIGIEIIPFNKIEDYFREDDFHLEVLKQFRDFLEGYNMVAEMFNLPEEL